MKELGFKEVEVHEKAENLYGYRGDKRKDTAEVIVRRKHVGSSSNDIGFKLNSDGEYEAIISDYDKSIGYGQGWLTKLETSYAIEQTKTAFHNHGWQYSETKNDKGEVQLVGVSF